MKTLLHVSLRQKAVFIPQSQVRTERTALNHSASVLVANLAKLGFGVSEPLLHALNHTTPKFQADLLETFRTVMGVQKNWTPLVKGWDTPTNESVIDHILTFFTNVFREPGTQLMCGHVIPANTFPLDRYTGCPFCGTPFQFGKIEKYGQVSKLKVLELWTEKDTEAFFKDLLTSKTALDATQVDSLKILMAHLPLPEVSIGMKETLMTVIDLYVAQNEADKAQKLFTSPTDVMRYLWYKHTGFLQIVEPKTIVKRQKSNHRHVWTPASTSAQAKLKSKAGLKLKYTRTECQMVARWLNNLPQQPDRICEMMHPKRGMWIRFIRALRLAEYSKRPGFEKLREVLDLFYTQLYDVWQGRVQYYRMRTDADRTLALLKQRPGLFARSLFANMLWFGAEPVVEAFADVVDQLPARLVFTLNMYAENYFSRHENRVVKPLGGVSKSVQANTLLSIYDDAQLEAMKTQVENLCIIAMQKRFAAQKTTSKTIYIDPALFRMPVSIGDRSDNVQDLPSALMGTRFAIEGDTVRLFMQWGTGLPAQHMDMDLSAYITYDTGMPEYCSYSYLTATGCKHSGDVRSIPNQIGTAEYIEINVNELRKAKASYVMFTCNAYSNGSLTPNLTVGWMNSRYKMHISERTGVAYDPSCVQHQVRITSQLTKGLVFGVLDVARREIVWLEMPFAGQVVQNMSTKAIEAFLRKLDSKLSVGTLLRVKADAQNLCLQETPDADEVYTATWAANTAAVTQLLVD